MFVVLYRWKLKEGCEVLFSDGWSVVTRFYLEKFDSLGSRLHLGDDGIWYGYAQWKSAEQRANAFEKRGEFLSDVEFVSSMEKMSQAVLETLPEIELNIVADYLQLPLIR